MVWFILKVVILVFCEIISVAFKIEHFFVPYSFSSHFFFSYLFLHKQGDLGLVSAMYFFWGESSEIFFLYWRLWSEYYKYGQMWMLKSVIYLLGCWNWSWCFWWQYYAVIEKYFNQFINKGGDLREGSPFIVLAGTTPLLSFILSQWSHAAQELLNGNHLLMTPKCVVLALIHLFRALDLVACNISIWLPNKHLSLNMSKIETLLSLAFPQISSSPSLLISVNGTAMSLG